MYQKTKNSMFWNITLVECVTFIQVNHHMQQACIACIACQQVLYQLLKHTQVCTAGKYACTCLHRSVHVQTMWYVVVVICNALWHMIPVIAIHFMSQLTAHIVGRVTRSSWLSFHYFHFSWKPLQQTSKLHIPGSDRSNKANIRQHPRHVSFFFCS